MKCYFSGTDEQELHDNAPNHNYYLSLIVNFKSSDEWCAKVAYVGKEEQKGVITSSYMGTDGDLVKSETTVSNETDVLYTIDVDIEVESPIDLPKVFTDRIIDLKKPKPVVRPTYDYKGYNYNRGGAKETPVAGAWRAKGSASSKRGQAELFDSEALGGMPSWWDEYDDVLPRVTVDVSKDNIILFTNKLLSLSDQPTTTLGTTLELLEKALIPEAGKADDSKEVDKELYLEAVGDRWGDLFTSHFKVKPTNDAVNAVLLKIEDYALDGSAIDKEMPGEILALLWIL
jgi:hypothetical protein